MEYTRLKEIGYIAKRLRKLSFMIVFILCFFSLGIFFSLIGTHGWDDGIRMRYSEWLLAQFHLHVPVNFDVPEKWYGPLWDLFLGLLNNIVNPYIHDTILIRHAATFTLFPFTLLFVYLSLRKSGLSKSHAVLAVSMQFSIIRFGGHALVNTKDFPLAAGYLMVSLWMWLALDSCHKKGFTVPRLLQLGCVSALPFLLRPLVILHPILLVSTLLCIFLGQKNMNLMGKLMYPLVPIIGGMIFSFLLYPPIWEFNLMEVKQAIEWFTHRKGPSNSFFGTSYSYDNQPWWYSIAWIPIVMHPLNFILFTAGSFLSLAILRERTRGFILRFFTWNWWLSLQLWMLIIVVGGFAGVIIAKPNLYNEERHLLFLFPPLVLFSSLSFSKLRPTLQNIFSILLISSALFSYAKWGRYAYVYKSTMIRNINLLMFSGDYWVICVPKIAWKAATLLPKNALIVLDSGSGNFPRLKGPSAVFRMELKRMKSSRLLSKNVPAFALLHTPPIQRPYYVLGVSNPSARYKVADLLRDTSEGKAMIVAQENISTNDPACVLAKYE